MDSKSRSPSRIKDLVKFLSSVQGDLSNVTAPPAFLAPTSVAEVGHCWAQRPALFAAPALEPDPAKRAYLVLRHVLSALRAELYIGGCPKTSIKKPLNPFLGELFLASWSDPEAKCTTRLVAEQVSHHPPITAMHISDEAHGVRADGYARVEMSFNGTVEIRQVGHAILHVDKYDEDHLIPLPVVKIRGFMSGRLYPEVTGTYTVQSSSGFVSEITFSGAGLCWGGQKNGFSATTFRKDDPDRTPIFRTEGVWSQGWETTDARTGEVVDKYDLDAPENQPVPMEIAPLEEQDPWESRRAWKRVEEAISGNKYTQAVSEKSKLEQAQRDMRAAEKERGRSWEPLLFRSTPGQDYDAFHQLAEGTAWELHAEKSKGVWRVDESRLGLQKPFRGELTPFG